MKTRKFLRLFLAQALILSMGCSSAMKVFNDNPLINSVISQIPGLSQLQAVGGVGALLALAKAKLPSVDFSKLASLVPNVDSMIEQATKAGGLPASLNSLADLGGTFSKLGISQDQASKMVLATTDFFAQKGGAEVGNMLAGVLK